MAAGPRSVRVGGGRASTVTTAVPAPTAAPAATAAVPTATTAAPLPGGDEANATLDAFVEAYDAEDLAGVMALFAEDSVMVAHPAGPFAVGIDDIQSVFADDVGQRHI